MAEPRLAGRIAVVTGGGRGLGRALVGALAGGKGPTWLSPTGRAAAAPSRRPRRSGASGTDRCDCQMVVLLVYGGDYQPVSLVAHSYDGKTWFSLEDTPQQRSDPRLERAIRQALPVESAPPVGQARWSHAS